MTNNDSVNFFLSPERDTTDIYKVVYFIRLTNMCEFRITDNIEQLSCAYFLSITYFLVSLFVQVFCPIFIGLSVFFLWSYKVLHGVMEFFEPQVFITYMTCKYVSQPETCLCIYLMMCFENLEFRLTKPNLSVSYILFWFHKKNTFA